MTLICSLNIETVDDLVITTILKELKDKIHKHNLSSGEIILEFDQILPSQNNETKQIVNFFAKYNIKTTKKDFEVNELTEDMAKTTVFYGLSTKINYTAIDIEFTDKDKNIIWYNFTSLFNNPSYYHCNCRIYQAELDLGDFWESGGVIISDHNYIGILWINDLYDMF